MAGGKERPVPIEPAEPAGEGDYLVKEGECLNSIAAKAGFSWKTLWNHPKNRPLKDARKDHNVLLPGDKVFIPEKTMREESGASDQLHKFRRKGVPSKIKLRLQKDGDSELYSGKRYVLSIDGKFEEGTVDGDGIVQIPIHPEGKHATLTVGDGNDAETFELDIGALDPVDSVRGAQQRLRNLGFFPGEPGNTWDAKAKAALSRFQGVHVVEKEDEEPTGVYDEKTRKKLLEVYQC